MHQNYFSSGSYRGGQVFYDKESVQGKAFAAAVQEKLNGLYGRENAKPRTEKTGDFFMLKCCENPSILVECGFLSNPNEATLFETEEYRQEIAFVLFCSIMSYISDFGA